jgi:hypothetical protein
MKYKSVGNMLEYFDVLPTNTSKKYKYIKYIYLYTKNYTIININTININYVNYINT